MKQCLSATAVFLAAGFLFLLSGMAVADNTAPPEKTPKDTVVYAISVKKAPNDVKAFGFDMLYSTDALKLEGLQKGALIKDGFSFFKFNEVSPGRVRMGGFAPDDNYMKKGASGELIVMTFKKTAKSSQPAEIKIVDIKDHMKLWGSYSVLAISEKK
ncbi:MAG: cohesin domain-containing protein [Thermodesulfobacteriota bacterium]